MLWPSRGGAILRTYLAGLQIDGDERARGLEETLGRGVRWIQTGEGSDLGFFPALRALLTPPAGAAPALPLGTDPDRLSAGEWIDEAGILVMAHRARVVAIARPTPIASDDDAWITLGEAAALASRSLRYTRGILGVYLEDGMVSASRALEFFRAERVPGC